LQDSGIANNRPGKTAQKLSAGGFLTTSEKVATVSLLPADGVSPQLKYGVIHPG